MNDPALSPTSGVKLDDISPANFRQRNHDLIQIPGDILTHETILRDCVNRALKSGQPLEQTGHEFWHRIYVLKLTLPQQAA